MSLAKEDLAAIDALIKNHMERVIKRIDELDDTLSQQSAVAFEDVYKKINSLAVDVKAIKQTVGRIESVLINEVDRNNKQDETIKQIRKTLHAA